MASRSASSRSTRCSGPRSSGAEHLAGDPAEPLAELVQPVAPDGEPGGHLVPAVALEQVAAGEQRRVQVEPRDAPPRALADVAVEGDEKRRPAVPLDHARRHDPHHARMPALAREHEAGVPLGIARLLHLRERFLQHPLVERLALDVEPLQPPGQLGGLDRIVGEQQPEPVGRVADPPGRVEPRAQDVAHVAGAELLAACSPLAATSARSPGHRLSARSRRPWRTRIRFSPTSGTTSATVASATRSSRWYGRLGGRPSAGTSACTSLKAMPVPQSARAPDVSSARCGSTTASAGGSSAPGRWWSVTTTPMPAARAARTVSTAVMPQSQVMTSEAPSALCRGEAGGPEVVAVAQPVRHEAARRPRPPPGARG